MIRFLSALLIIISFDAVAQKTISSPDNNIQVSISGGQTLSISAKYKNTDILQASEIGMSVRNIKNDWTFKKSSVVSKNEIIHPAVTEKRKEIVDHYNQLTVDFKTKISLQVRVYNDGFAYRFTSTLKDSITVDNETASYSIPTQSKFYGSAVVKRDDIDEFHTSFEEPYLIKPIDSIPDSKLFFTPVLISYTNNIKAVITESDIEDYPGTFLRFNNKKLSSVNAGYPKTVKVIPGEFPAEVVTSRENFIARTKGTRTFPWRVFMLSEKDSQLPSNDMVYRLGSPSRVAKTDWIKPGKGTDEWIIGINLFNIPFKAGLNTETYKYYIDFAKRFGFERIMMDAGWSDNTDLLKINPNIDMDEIAAYAKRQGVSLSMWTLAYTLDRQLQPALEQFKKWGIDFIMTDFMDRDDQKMVNFYHRIAKACAEKEIMIMYHGAFKTAGFGRTWPNAITREGVLGSEYNVWSEKATPDHDLLLPFIRMTAGPMDYEPGSLDNATKQTFRPISEKVMSMGTRMHQAAMFVVYESPIQLFSGNPSQGHLEPEYMSLVGEIPTTWDQTIVVDGKLGEYIVTARKKGANWYIAGMTNWASRTIDLDLSFIEGSYDATLAIDGVNADRYPSDHSITHTSFTKKMKITMAKGGGFVVILKPKKN